MEHLFAAWPRFTSRIEGSEQVLVACDFDGTLSPIVCSPALATLPEQTRQILDRLCRDPRFTIAVVSGRALLDLESKVGIPGLVYSGNHGLEIRAPGFDFVQPQADRLRPVMEDLGRVLRRELEGVPGVIVEEKGLTASVHYRRVEAAQITTVLSICQRTVAASRNRGETVVRFGKSVCDVRPAVKWDKGDALSLIFHKAACRGSSSSLLPVYFGDDETDEDGFRAVKSLGGFSVRVDESIEAATCADYRLADHTEVWRALELFANASHMPYCKSEEPDQPDN